MNNQEREAVKAIRLRINEIQQLLDVLDEMLHNLIKKKGRANGETTNRTKPGRN